MSVLVSCPVCGCAAELPEEQRGRKVRCGDCQQLYVAVPVRAPVEVPLTQAVPQAASPLRAGVPSAAPTATRAARRSAVLPAATSAHVPTESPLLFWLLLGGLALVLVVMLAGGAMLVTLWPQPSARPGEADTVVGKGDDPPPIVAPIVPGPAPVDDIPLDPQLPLAKEKVVGPPPQAPKGVAVLPVDRPAKEAPLLFLDKQEAFPLPAPVADVAVGGGGRYLFLFMPTRRELAVFDVRRTKLLPSLPMPGEHVRFAAGRDKLVVIDPSSQIIQRWNLTTWKQDASDRLQMKVPPVAVAMGYASDGPLVISGVDHPRLCETVFYDVLRMKSLKVDGDPHRFFDASPTVFLRAAANGQVFACQDQVWGGKLQTCVWRNGRFQCWVQAGRGDWPVPSAEGATIYTTAGRRSVELAPAGRWNAPCWPADQGPLFLSFGRTDFQPAGKGGKTDKGPKTIEYLGVHLAGHDFPFARLVGIESPEKPGNTTLPYLSTDQRIHLFPNFKLLVSLAATNDRLVVRSFDLEQALVQCGLDYLLVTSLPPPSARLGEEYAYQVRTLSKRGVVQYALESAPKDMHVTAEGKLHWKVPAQMAEADVAVRLRVVDPAEREIVHNFFISVLRPEP
jgi:hypothetical protein